MQAGVINNFCQLVDPEGVRQELSYLKSLNVDGVSVACWWGIVERWNPQKFVWYGYRELFNIIQEFKLKLQVTFVSSRHVIQKGTSFKIVKICELLTSNMMQNGLALDFLNKLEIIIILNVK